MATLGVPAALAVLLGVALTLAVCWVVLPRPTIALALVGAVVVSSVSDVVGGAAPVSPYLASVALAAGALVLGIRRGLVRPVWSPVIAAALGFLVTRALSLLVARDTGAGQAVLVDEAKGVVLLVVVTTLAVAVRRVRLVVAVLVGVVSVLAGLTIVQEFLLSNRTTFGGLSNIPLPSELPGLGARHSGPEADVNFWARTLVLICPLALSLAWGGRGVRRWVWAGAAAVCSVAAYLTQSRGGLLALAVALTVWLVLVTRSAVRTLVAVGVVGAAILLMPGVGSRLATVGSVGSTAPAADQSLVDRAAVQRIGWAMALEHPFVGVGVGNFTTAEPDYRRRIAPELSQVIAPHNIYLEMLAEGGLVGLGGWLLFYGAALFAGGRALVRLRALDGRGPPSGATRVGAGVLAGLVGWGVASVFLHLADFPVLVVAMGLAAGLDVRAGQLGGDRLRLAERPAARHRMPARSRIAVAGGLAAAVAIAGVAAAALSRGRVYTATSAVVVEPLPAGADAYVYDVLSRPAVITTYAALFRDRGLLLAAAREAGVSDLHGAAVEVRQVSSSAAFAVSVTSSDARTAALLSPALVDRVRTLVESTGGLYVVRPVE